MTKQIYVDNGPLGHDSNVGTHPKRPKKTLAGAVAAGLSSGDEMKLRYGCLFEEPLTVKTNGVSYSAYHTGSEDSAPPMISVKGAGSVGIRVEGKENTFADIDEWHAETGVLVAPGMDGNQFTRVPVRDFGFGYLIKASHTIITDPYVGMGRMVRNTGKKSDAGAQAFVLWKEPGYAHTGTRITGAFVEQAWADALAFEDGDGACVEIFGGVRDVVVSDLVGIDNTVLVEIGGTPSRLETVSDIVFAHCLTMNSGGKVLFINAPDSDFYANWEGVRFTCCTFNADEYDESPFFIAGKQGDLSKKLRVEGCVVVGTSQIYNAGEGTQLDSIQRTGNVYWRTDGSTNVGLSLRRDEVFADPRFVNPEGRDYRLKPGHPGPARVGALDSNQTIESDIGYNVVPEWIDMTAIPMKHRQAGMRCRVVKHRLLYELQDDRQTWLKVQQFAPRLA